MKTILFLLAFVILQALGGEPASTPINSYDPNLGVMVGSLPDLEDGGVSGNVYIVNDTTIQIIDFSYNGKAPEMYFWLDKKSYPTVEGLKLPTAEYGPAPLGAYDNVKRVVLRLPFDETLRDYRSISLFNPSTPVHQSESNISTLAFNGELNIPKPQFLAPDLKGSRYAVSSGPIVALDRRTIKVFGFNFEGHVAPDGYFFVGRGPNVAHDAGVKVPILGKDTPELITPMNEHYRGGKDIYLTLPEDYDVDHIEWISVYCYKYRVDFGHITISNDSSKRIPPYVPRPKRDEEKGGPKVDKWPVTTLLGSEKRLNFTFQLGHPGGRKGFQGLTHQQPPKYVWYVNGYMAELYLRRGTTYTFIVEGGKDAAIPDFNNPLYVTDSANGGHAKQSIRERMMFTTFAGGEAASGRLCVWSSDDFTPDQADRHSSFIEFRNQLELKCEGEKSQPLIFTFTPTTTTPGTLYYQSWTHYNMGNKIHIVDELPAMPDWEEEPYEYEHWRKQNHASPVSAASAASFIISCFALMAALLI